MRGLLARRERGLIGVIGPAAAAAGARRDLLRLVAFLLAWLIFIPMIVWAQLAGGPLTWSLAGLSGACVLAIFIASLVFGHRTVTNANAFVGRKLGYPVRLGSNLNAREWRLAIEREQHFHGSSQLTV
jgi:hypothetical protein